MNWHTKQTSHYSVMGEHPIHGFITLNVSRTLLDALEYVHVHALQAGEIWRVLMDGSVEKVASWDYEVQA